PKIITRVSRAPRRASARGDAARRLGYHSRRPGRFHFDPYLIVRLTQIKLGGFKSFVDPTSIPTPSRLVGVVGPNGCGKSNIIDAVRWVLGETKASEPRGKSMRH